MSADTPCVHCQTVGFVRREHVITAAAAQILYYCGCCDHSWSVAEKDEPRARRRPARILTGDLQTAHARRKPE